jgi:hypothetical protein
VPFGVSSKFNNASESNNVIMARIPANDPDMKAINLENR